MVDCGNPRCAQERRSFRRDLQPWSKKLSVVLGLERIAADYVDKDTARKLLNPYPEWEDEMSQDFEPSKRCFHCEKKLPNVYKRIQRVISDAKKGKENSGKICLRSLQDLMPFCLDFYTHGFGRELFSDVVKTHFLTLVQQPEIKEELDSQIPPSTAIDILAKLRVPHLAGGSRSNKKGDSSKQSYTEGNLDCAVSDVRTGKLGTRRAAVMYGVPRSTLRNKMVKPEPEEIIIPDDDEEEERPLALDLHLHDVAHSHHRPSFKLSEASLFGMNELMLPPGTMPFLPAIPYPISLKLEQDDHDHLLELRLNHIRRLHNLNGLSEIRPRPAHANHLKLPLLVDIVRKLVHQKFLEIKREYGKKRPSYEMKSSQETELFSPFGPYLPAFSPYLAGGHNDENVTAPVYKHIMESIYPNMMKEENSIPKPFGKVNESSRIGDTLKDIIAKTISEKMRFREGSSDESSLPSTPDIYKSTVNKSKERNSFGQNAELPHSSRESRTVTGGGCSPPKRVKKDSSSKATNHTPGSASDSGCPPPKKTRPKRGQYRKYNSQLLMDAVKAVQRGEMSVHRAGSYFGVPHSTLEYKVKERHLLRQKKSRDSQSPSASNKSDIPTTTTQGTGRDSSPAPDDDTSKKQNSSSSTRSSSSSLSPPPASASSSHQKAPPPSTSHPSSSSSSPLPLASSALGVTSSKEVGSLAWFQPYLASPTPRLDSSIGLIPPSLTLNNSASELLRKLQHKVQAKGTAFPSDSAFDLPCSKERVFDLGQPGTSSGGLADRVALYNQSV